MAQLHRSFDATEVPSADPFEVLPDNTLVPAVLEKSEMKANSAQTGHYLALTFRVHEGEHEGRMFFANLNLDNPNEQAVKIAERELSALCKACGKLKVEDSEELHEIPILLKLGVEKERTANGTTYPARNRIKDYKPIDEAPKAAAGKVPEPTPGAAPTTKKAAPWSKK